MSDLAPSAMSSAVDKSTTPPSSSVNVVPALGLPSSATPNGTTSAALGTSAMRMFTPRQQPSTAHRVETRGKLSARAGNKLGTSQHTDGGEAAQSTAVPSGSPPSSSISRSSVNTPAATSSIPAKKLKPSTRGKTSGTTAAKGPDAIPSKVPSPSASGSHNHRVSGGGITEGSIPRHASHQRTPRLTHKVPPSTEPVFSNPPHKRPVRSAAQTSAPPAVARTGDDAATLSSSTLSRDYVRPPARTTPRQWLVAAIPATGARASTSEEPSSYARGLSEESVPPPSSSAPPQAQASAPHHADPTPRLSSASVVRPFTTAPSKPLCQSSGDGTPHTLCVHPPQQTATLGAATPGHASGTSSAPHAAPPATNTSAAASSKSPTAPTSSRRTIPSRSVIAVGGGGRGGSGHNTITTVRPVGSARAGEAATQNRAASSRADSTMHMADLVRPSEAYKLKLTPTAQQRTVARRSRQPRKIVNTCLTKYTVIRRVAEAMGFEIQESEDDLNAYQFNLCWSDTVLPLVRLVRLGNWQRTNHFPSMYLLCRKLHLATTLGRMQRNLPHDFHFFPMTWSLRSERAQFVRYLTALKQKKLVKYFIVKPNVGCQGRGIQVTRDPLTCVEDLDNYIVQEYIPRPLLIEERKFDLRVYVLLTSIREPSIFMYNDGLVRMCAEIYEAPTDANVKNTCKHLTNYAVNKKNPEFVYNTDAARGDVGNKRDFRFFNRWLSERGQSPQLFWDQVGFVIVKTILSAQPHIAMVYNSCFPRFNEGHTCFEILGFDILVDHKMKPWLMEVNHTPSFATDTPLDDEIKTGVLTEAWDIVDCKATDYERDRQRERHDFAARNMQRSVGTVGSARLRRPAGMGNAYNDGPSSPENDEQAELQARRADEQLLIARMHEDSKLRNYVRIYPTHIPAYDDVYRTVRSHAEADAVVRANSGSMFVSGVNGPVVVPHSIGLASSPTSAGSPCAADTYRFAPNRSDSADLTHHQRTPSSASEASAEANHSSNRPERIPVASALVTPAHKKTSTPPVEMNQPSQPTPQQPTTTPVPTRADNYKKMEEEMSRVRCRASQDTPHSSHRNGVAPQQRPSAQGLSGAEAEASDPRPPSSSPPAATTTDASAHVDPKDAGTPATPTASTATVYRSHKSVPPQVTAAGHRGRAAGLTNVAATAIATGAAQASGPVSVPEVPSSAPVRPNTGNKPRPTSKTPTAPAAETDTETAAAESHALVSVAPLADNIGSNGIRHTSTSHHSSAHNTPLRGARRSGASTPRQGPSKSAVSKTSKAVSPEDLRRLESLQEQLERAEEAEPENHESDESFDLDE